jgi:hypothetical protein
MKEKIAKQVIHWLSVIIVGIALGLGLQFVRAWTEPGANPPGGNVGAPLNTSANTQVKAGSLGINSNGNPVGLMVNGSVGIGTTAPDVKLDVVGGTAQADDFCLQDNSKCLSSAGSGGGGGTFFIDPIEIYDTKSPSNGSWFSVDYPTAIPNDAKYLTLHFNVLASSGDSIIKIKAANLSEREAAYANAGSSWAVASDTNTKTIPYSSDRKLQIYWKTRGCKNGNCWAQIYVEAYQK